LQFLLRFDHEVLMMALATLILAAVTLQRLGELLLANRNTARLLARGGVEKSPDHYILIVVMHAAWLLWLWIVATAAIVNFWWLAIFVVLQGLRIWVIATLGDRWTTRIIVVPGEARVRRGPYRYVDHPNYLIVAAELIALPMALGQPLIAIIFTVLNAAVLWVRIRAEALALAEAEPPSPRQPA
jgi:methyltransferase